MGNATIEMEARFRRLWVLTLAFHVTELINRVYPLGNRLIDFAGRFTRVDCRQVGEKKWRTTGRLHLLPICDDCDDPDGFGCRCTQWSQYRMERS